MRQSLPRSASAVDDWSRTEESQMIDAVVFDGIRQGMVLSLGTKYERLGWTKTPRQVVEPRGCPPAAAANAEKPSRGWVRTRATFGVRGRRTSSLDNGPMLETSAREAEDASS